MKAFALRNWTRILWMSTLLVLAITGAALATRPSGPGINTKANSLSVAIATDQVNTLSTVADQKPAVQMTAVTPSDSTDTTSYCNRGIYVGHDAGVSNVQVVPASQVDAAAAYVADAAAGYPTAVTFKFVPNGTTIPGQFIRVQADASTANGVICLGN